MKIHISALPDGSNLDIDAEPLSFLMIHLTDLSSLDELKPYALAHGIRWVEESREVHCLLLPKGTFQQRIEEHCSLREEVFLVHLPQEGMLELRRFLPWHINAEYRWADDLKISMISLLRPIV